MARIVGIIKNGTITIDGEELEIGPSLKVRNHSPTGFSWGYNGSGPTQLALAIMLKYTPRDVALAFYRQFRLEVVAKWPQEDFSMEIDVLGWIYRVRHEASR